MMPAPTFTTEDFAKRQLTARQYNKGPQLGMQQPTCLRDRSTRRICLEKELEDLHEIHPIDPCILTEYDSSQLGRPIHVMSPSTVEQMYIDILDEKTKRSKSKFANYLAQMGSTGSYHWPNEIIVNNLPPDTLEKVDFYGTVKQHHHRPAYDCNYHLARPDNQYKYSYNLHREDRRHAKMTGLDANIEEMARPPPGILVNSDYGRRYQNVYPTERHHRIAWHKAFFRSRGSEGAK